MRGKKDKRGIIAEGKERVERNPYDHGKQPSPEGNGDDPRR
jgi:hypothetical protein